MKTLVVYRSHYGSTRRYAQWLAQALDADAAEERQADARLVQNYECVIFGGGLYAGSIAGAARMAKLYGALQGKRLAMFTVGLSDPSDPENVKKIMQDAARAFTPEMLENICFFHLSVILFYIFQCNLLKFSFIRCIYDKGIPHKVTEFHPIYG